MNRYNDVLKELAKGSKASQGMLSILKLELNMPNIPFPTMGGEVFWNTLAECNGWKLQQNMITHHARIIDRENVRIAWGTIAGMTKAMDRMVEYLDKYKIAPEQHIDAMNQLKKLKELLDIGAITEEEFLQKKKQLMDLI